MTYILIIVASTWLGASIETVEGFPSKAACEVARSDIGRHIEHAWTACITLSLRAGGGER
jgi:hypothetical protein